MTRRASLLGGAVVLATAGLGIAIAAVGDGSVVPAPPVSVIRPATNTAGSASVTLTNNGSAAVTVGELVADGTCDPGVTTTPGVPVPFAIAPNQARAVEIACAATPDTSIRRCEFHARTAAHAPLADYTGLCVSPGQLALTLDPASGVSFGDVALGAQRTLPVVLTNTGATKVTAEAIHVADQVGDFQIGSPCASDGPGCDAIAEIDPGSALSFDLRCAPTQLGARTTQLYVTTNNGGAAGPYPVDCNGVPGGAGPSLALDVTSVDVGDVPVATGSAASTIHVTNIGGGDLHIASIALAGGATSDWSFVVASPCAQTPCVLAAGASVGVDVAFDPSALDGRGSTLEIRSDDASHPTTVIALGGKGLGATLAVDAAVAGGVELGSVAVGASSTFTLALRNDGNAPLAPVTLAITQDGSDPPPPAFAVDSPSLTIGPSGSSPVAITCTPPDHIAYTGTLTITATGALSGSPIAIPLTCTGVAGTLVATPSPLQLGEIRTGGGTVMQTITLTTLAGTVAITQPPSLTTPLASVTIGDLSAASVSPASPVTFQLAIDPQHDSSLVDHLTIAAGASSLDIPLTGKIVTAGVTPSVTRDLGSFCVGEPTAAALVSLTASGTSSIGLPSAPALVRGDASPFQIAPVEPSVFPVRLPSGARASAQVTAKRQSTAGTVTDDVAWSDDVAGMPSPHTTVNATFIDDGGAISPGSIDFGAAPIHLTEPTDQIITIQNCGTEAMTLAAPTISPSGQFYTVGALPPQLLPAQAATISVGFGPVSVGDFTASLTVPATKGTDVLDLVVVLHGVGAVTTPPSGNDAGSGPPGDTHPGCGCRAGDDPAGALLVLAVCALGLRRRGRATGVTLELR